MRRLDEFYTEYPDLGHRRLVALLTQEGKVVNVKRVRRLRGLMGLEAQFPKPNLSRPGQPRQRFGYLLKGLIISQIHQVWATAQAALRHHVHSDGKRFFYLLAILDLRSRYVLHWQLSNTLDTDWCVEALRETLEKWGKPMIFNTDQGSQFTSDEFVGVLQDHQIAISWDGKGWTLDNIFVERFWRSVNYENVYLNRYENGLALRRGLDRYMTYYNEWRPHQSLGYETPANVLAEGTKI